jgi:uncharacterized glyoxalase superfamily protein PhnB
MIRKYTEKGAYVVVNRSAPPGPVVPGLYYEDVGAAIEWLCGAFGFTEIYRYGPPGAPVGAFLAAGDGSVALSLARVGQSPDWEDDAELRPNPAVVSHGVSVRVDDVDVRFELVTNFGARVFGPPATYQFGERQFTAEDLGGHRWTFTQSVADVSPADWGATMPGAS